MERLANHEPRRLRTLRKELANAVPRFPNNRETLKLLEEKSLGGILVDYLNWSKRYVTPRKREVQIEYEALSDHRFALHRNAIEAILGKAQRGEDLTPYLSTQVRTRGYSPGAGSAGPGGDRWCDKDFVLNVMGMHHFHLDAMQRGGERSNDMLFAEVTKTTFTLVGIFNHDVFEQPPFWSFEKQRLWKIFESRLTAGAPPGAVLVSAPIATSGHSIETTYRAMTYAKKIAAMDHLLDQEAFAAKIYSDAKQKLPKKTRFKWAPWFQELGIYDASTRIFFSVCGGWN